MLEACSTQTPDALQDAQPAAEAVLAMRELIERMQAELKFEKTRNAALNFEIAPEALALRLVQREPGQHDAGGAVRRHRGRHRARRACGRGRDRAAAHGTNGEAPGRAPGAARQPAAHRSSSRDRADPLRVRPGP